ncbi:hypothetical protein SAMN02949497_3474 [Methylomagnum ishizawai]|uniref:Phage abortive infection protein n=1 Tax=Methylomagnum ishizawai TaxID=1760988 RepID=A0A1Y6D0H1_9GAMM|nr:hypothetical protein [Methylomagnum ishizawai]SMF96091.1 hypothetical protein SAMN02949497_3474 [Methylomagnum ishizawai]
MRPVDIFEVAAAIITSLGGAAVVLFGLSSWLGKFWASKLLAEERAKHEKELESIKANLKIQTDSKLAQIDHWLTIEKETHLKHHNDKINIYRLSIDLISNFLHEIEQASINPEKIVQKEVIERFLMQRLQVYGYLAMLAHQEVMDRFDALIDLLLDIIYDNKNPSWHEIRSLAITLLNAVRADLGISSGTIEYRGRR